MRLVFLQIAAEREKDVQKEEEEKQQTSMAQQKLKEDQAPKTFKAGVGKYINPATKWGHTHTHTHSNNDETGLYSDAQRPET